MTTVRTIGIRGAGLSGMSVARELLKADPNLNITLFDRRTRLPHPERTFCFFKESKTPPLPCRSFNWQTVMFRGASFERRIDVSSSPYTMIRGDDFFEQTLSNLESSGACFRWGCGEVSLDDSSIKADGEVFSFDRVIDAAFEATQSRSIMWQSFAGVWVTTDSELFDPSTATLMDLQESSPEAPVSFLYVLPISKHRALLEHTTFSPTPLSKEYHLERCSMWLKKHAHGQVSLGETEHGLIPMGLHASRSHLEMVVGSTAGMVRPATGYAFLATQEHARQIAHHILNRAPRAPRAYPWWLTAADVVFLRALLAAPEHGEYLMERLLSRSKDKALISFLAGSATFKEALSVWLSIPKSTMLRSLARV